MAINKKRFKRINEILFNYKDTNELLWALIELDNDEQFPKDNNIEKWREIIEFCRNDIECQEQGYLQIWQRWAEEIGE